MEPRLIYRTHYQVEEPAYVTFLVRHCSSPVQSDYPERLAQRLSEYISKRGRRFNPSAASYAVDLAQALGVISSNGAWTESAQLIALVAAPERATVEAMLDLSPAEQFLYFRLFIAADGAVLAQLARAAVEHGSIPHPAGSWNEFANEVFVTLYTQYLREAAETRDRVALRKEIERLRSRPFSGRTGQHKLFVHLQTMFRLGLLERDTTASARQYSLGERAGRLRILIREVPDVLSLESLMAKHAWAELAHQVFRNAAISRRDFSDELLIARLIEDYWCVASTGVPLCSLSTLIDAAQIHMLAQGFNLRSSEEIRALLSDFQKRHPKDVRFHVDRLGRPAFMKLADGLKVAP